MAQGEFKSGEIINLVYQAAALLSNAIPVGVVYDETKAIDGPKTTTLTSALLAGEKAGGRYFGYFTPDAEGIWTVTIVDKNGAGPVAKVYNVCGFNIDSIGDSVPSQLLLTKSSLVSAILVDCNASTSDVKSAVVAQASDVKSAVTVVGAAAASAAAYAATAASSAAVAAIASPAMVS